MSESLSRGGTDRTADPARIRGISGGPLKSSDGGRWTDITANLPDVFAGAVAVHRCGREKRIFLGTDIGLFVSEDDGGSWSTAQRGIPSASAIVDIKVDPRNDSIWASNYGRGMYVLDLDCP